MDGARVLVHKVGSEVAVCTRGLRNVAAGHEGVMVKAPDGLYEPGERSRNRPAARSSCRARPSRA